MRRISVSTTLDERSFQILEDLLSELGPPKNRILEAALCAFAALPVEIKYVLRSNRDEDQQMCLDLIRTLGIPSKQVGRASGTKKSKLR